MVFRFYTKQKMMGKGDGKRGLGKKIGGNNKY